LNFVSRKTDFTSTDGYETRTQRWQMYKLWMLFAAEDYTTV